LPVMPAWSNVAAFHATVLWQFWHEVEKPSSV
jgi:hypothetical protein